MALHVNEIFYSIQGESLHMGRPCVFIRLTGCNLRCHYCDTQYAYDEGEFFSIPQLIDTIKCFSCNLIEVTGGEPLLQTETPLLVSMLLDEGFEVLVETNGSQDISRLDDRSIRIVDIKCPASGESNKNYLKNLDHLSAKDQIKFVISDRNDFDFAKEFLDHLQDLLPLDHILFSPVHQSLSPDQLAEWILQEKLRVRLQLQLHKLIWPFSDRGV
jgi:7-carboxy-7-deazaguanine synthase